VLNKVDKGVMDRKGYARLMLTEATTHSPIIQSDQAMELLCEKDSPIRTDGDDIAHPALTKDFLPDLYDLQSEVDKTYTSVTQQEGMGVLIGFFIDKLSQEEVNGGSY
jgi:hypothetical protein